MAKHSIFKSYMDQSPLSKYVTEHSQSLTSEQIGLNEVTLKHPKCVMLGAPESLQLTANLIRLIGAKKILDVGVYTGASALSGALAMPDDGKVFALDINEEFMEIGKPFWKKAGVDHKIKVCIGPALDTLQKLIDAGDAGTFDFAFIDADKVNMSSYYEKCLALVRSGGIVALDNTIWSGKVADDADQSPQTNAIRALNKKLKDDPRINLSYLIVGDGLSLCFKK